MIAAVENHTIAGAGLDVFEGEPAIDPRFFALENTVLTPHIASATAETRQAMAQNVADNLASWFAHGKAITPVA
nr:NAD(P)-dependent oxidoreductase [Erwinia sp. S43]